MDVVDVGVDVLVLVAGLHRVRAEDRRVVDAPVLDERILELRIAVLPTPRRPAGHRLLGEAARELFFGRQPGDAVALEHVRGAGAERGLAGLGPGQAEPHFEQGAARERPRDAERQLLVEHLDEGVGRAARLAGDRRRLEVVDLAVAETHEAAGLAPELLVDLHVDLVVVVGPLRQAVEVVRGAGRVGAGRPSRTLRANGVIADAGITPSA